jgi:hypothetical protein
MPSIVCVPRDSFFPACTSVLVIVPPGITFTTTFSPANVTGEAEVPFTVTVTVLASVLVDVELAAPVGLAV